MSPPGGDTVSPRPAGVESLFEPRLAVDGTAQFDEAVSVAAWAPDGAGLVAGTLGGEVALCGRDGRVAVRLDTAAPVLDVCWSPTGDMVAAGCEDGSLWLWAAGGEPRRHALGDAVEQLAWGASGLAAATGDAVVVLDAAGTNRVDLAVPPGAALVVAWTGSGAGAALLAGGVGGLREVLVGGSGGEAWPRAAVVALAVDPTTGVVAAGTLGGDVEIGRRGPTLAVGRDAIAALSWSASGSRLAAVADGRLAVWALHAVDGTVTGPRRLVGHGDWVTGAAFSPVGPLLASVGADGGLALWDPAQTVDPLERVELGGPLDALAWRPDGRALVAGSRDGLITVVDCSQLAPASG
jgi:WD40 repeat protein